MTLSGLPFDDIRALLADLPDGDDTAGSLARERNKQLADKFGLVDLNWLEWVAQWSGKSPVITRPLIALFAGNHEISEQFSELPEMETIDLVTHLSAGGAPINQVCATHDIGLKVFDLALQYPVGDISIEDALDEKGAAATIGFGMEAIAGGVDVLGLSAFGKGSEIANLVLLSILFDVDPNHIQLSSNFSANDKILEAVKRAADLHQSARGKPLELLRRIGGREHSAIAGAILAARTNHIPTILSGTTAFVVTSILEQAGAGSCDHCLYAGKMPAIGQMNNSPVTLKKILPDVLNSVDGSAAAIAIGMLKSYAAIHSNSVIEV